MVITRIAELGASYSKSYFYICFRNHRLESIPWNASSKYVKTAIEHMESVWGDVCVSRSLSAVNTNGFRWAVRFDTRFDDINYGFQIATANVYHDHEVSDISVTLFVTNMPLDDWVTDDGEKAMCTIWNTLYQWGAGTAKLTSNYEVLPRDRNSGLNIISNASSIITQDSCVPGRIKSLCS